MNNIEKFELIIDEAYDSFINSYKRKEGEIILPPFDYINEDGVLLSKEEFVYKIKTDEEFSREWGLKIEEKELNLEERAKWLQDNKGYDLLLGNLEHDHIREVVENESPTKSINVYYLPKSELKEMECKITILPTNGIKTFNI